MKPSQLSLRQLALGGFAFALALYAGGFALDQYWRTRRGPWEVRFESVENESPTIVITHPHLGISNVSLVLVGETSPPTNATLRFEKPGRSLPFGHLKYDDLTSWPGVVTLDLFGHEVELLPRALYVNRRPLDWSGPATLFLSPGDKTNPPAP